MCCGELVVMHLTCATCSSGGGACDYQPCTRFSEERECCPTVVWWESFTGGYGCCVAFNSDCSDNPSAIAPKDATPISGHRSQRRKATDSSTYLEGNYDEENTLSCLGYIGGRLILVFIKCRAQCKHLSGGRRVSCG